jgi:predicted RNase H-like HicB family nuclease
MGKKHFTDEQIAFTIPPAVSRLRRCCWPDYPSIMRIEVEQEEDQRWIAEVIDLPGVVVYGETRERAVAKAEALALRVIADRLDHGEAVPELDDLFVVSA